MKILQAVFGSGVETLEQSQGIGFLRRSKNLPESLLLEFKNFGYSSDAGGHAIFSLKTIEILETRWLLMNRTVQTTDYTHRIINLSHSIAIAEENLRKFLNESGGVIPSVFEFMRNFTWVSSWSGEPKELDDSEDLDASIVDAFRPESIDSNNPFDPAPLLAFENTVGTNPTPKRAIWNFDGKTAEEMLDAFHQAWLCLDPWQGMRKYGAHLGEPDVSLLDSWRFPFTTNLRHGRSSDYHWLVASPDCPSIPGVASIEPSRWTAETPDSIKDRIGRPLGDMLVERCVQGPETWATKQLEEKIAALESEYGKEIESVAATEKNEFTELIKSLRTDIKNHEDHVRDYIQKGIGKSAREAIETHLSGIRAEIYKCKTDAENNHTELAKSFLDKVTPLKLLLNSNKEHNAIDVESSEETLIFKELNIDFNEASEKYKLAYQQYCALWMEEQYQLKIQELAINVNNFAIKQAASDKEIGDLKSEISSKRDSIDSCQKTIADLKTRIPNPKNSKQMGWEMYSLISVSVLALALAVVIGLHSKEIFHSDPASTNKPASNEEITRPGLGRDNASQAETIEEHRSKIDRLESNLESAENDKKKLTEERDKVTSERNKFDDDLTKNKNAIADLNAKNNELEKKLTALKTANPATKETVGQSSDTQEDTHPDPVAPQTGPGDGKSGIQKTDDSSKQN